MNTTAFKAVNDEVIAAYRRLTPESASLYAKACGMLPGGVSGNLRFFDPYPLYIKTGAGCTSTDVDGNDYIDCFLLNGPLLLGHRPPEVLQEVRRHLAATGSLVLNPPLLVDCAALLCSIVPCAQKVRFVNSGTEAVLSAVRYARAFTKRSKIIKFFGHYHGQADQFLVGAGSRRVPFGNGVPPSSYADTLTLPFNDLAAVEAALAPGHDIAAVVLDPAMHSGGLWGTTREFLRQLRELTEKTGTVLVFDEVITGFRLSPGGAQQYYDVTPDLVTLAKALGAGEKLAAVAGRADIMSVVDPLQADPSRRVFQSGTGNDGTAGLASAFAAMNCYRRLGEVGAYDRLADLGCRLAEGLRTIMREASVPFHVNQTGSMLQIFFTDLPPSFVAYADLDPSLVRLFYLALITQGVMLSLPTSNHIYLSFAHTQAEVDHILAVTRRVVTDYRFADLF